MMSGQLETILGELARIKEMLTILTTEVQNKYINRAIEGLKTVLKEDKVYLVHTDDELVPLDDAKYSNACILVYCYESFNVRLDNRSIEVIKSGLRYRALHKRELNNSD